MAFRHLLGERKHLFPCPPGFSPCQDLHQCCSSWKCAWNRKGGLRLGRGLDSLGAPATKPTLCLFTLLPTPAVPLFDPCRLPTLAAYLPVLVCFRSLLVCTTRHSGLAMATSSNVLSSVSARKCLMPHECSLQCCSAPIGMGLPGTSLIICTLVTDPEYR